MPLRDDSAAQRPRASHRPKTRDQTQARFAYFRNGKLKPVDGDNRPEDVLKAILASLE